jgi:hypothetical protein
MSVNPNSRRPDNARSSNLDAAVSVIGTNQQRRQMAGVHQHQSPAAIRAAEQRITDVVIQF